jgi:hypothetical protein
VIFYHEDPFAGFPLTGFDAQFPAGVGGVVTLPDGRRVDLTIPGLGVGQNTGRCLAQSRDSSGALIARDCSPASPVTVTATAIFQGFGQLHIFDARDASNPLKLSTFATANSSDVHVALQNRFPNPVRTFTTTHFDVVGNTVYVGWEFDGLRIIDISRPSDPEQVGVWNGEGVPPGAPPVRAWQVLPHRDLVLLNSLGYGVYILKPAAASEARVPRP